MTGAAESENAIAREMHSCADCTAACAIAMQPVSTASLHASSGADAPSPMPACITISSATGKSTYRRRESVSRTGSAAVSISQVSASSGLFSASAAEKSGTSTPYCDMI